METKNVNTEKTMEVKNETVAAATPAKKASAKSTNKTSAKAPAKSTKSAADIEALAASLVKNSGKKEKVAKAPKVKTYLEPAADNPFAMVFRKAAPNARLVGKKDCINMDIFLNEDNNKFSNIFVTGSNINLVQLVARERKSFGLKEIEKYEPLDGVLATLNEKFPDYKWRRTNAKETCNQKIAATYKDAAAAQAVVVEIYKMFNK